MASCEEAQIKTTKSRIKEEPMSSKFNSISAQIMTESEIDTPQLRKSKSVKKGKKFIKKK